MAISYLNDINLNQNELQNAVIQSLGAEPSSGKAGQVYYNNGSINAANKGLWLYNGSQWVRVGVTYDLSAGTVSSNTVPINLVGSDGTTDTVNIKGAGGATITQSNGTITITTAEAATATPIIAGIGAVGTSSKYAKEDHVHPAQTSVTGNAGSATKLATRRGIDGILFDGTESIAHFATCNMTGSVYSVDITCSGFMLYAGSWIAIQFTGGGSSSSNALSLNINQQGGKNVKYYNDNNAIPADAYIFRDGRVYLLVYDGTDFRIVGDLDTSVSYDSGTLAQLRAGSVTQDEVWSPKIIHDYVSEAIAAADAMIFKGTLGTGGTVTALPTTYQIGWTYRVITAGTYAGQACEVGDLVIALVDRSGSGNLDSDWTVAQTNIDGAITTADASTTNPLMDGTAAYGSSTKYARADHVHPTDTTRVPTSRTVNGHALTGNVTVTNVDLGQGYSSTLSYNSTDNIFAVTLSSYLLTTGGVVSVKFDRNVPAAARLNINSKGAKYIRYKGSNITADTIKSGETATFMYDGTYYHLISIDRSLNTTPAGVYHEYNTLLTSTNGVCTWTIPNPSFSSGFVGIHVYDAMSGKEVMTENEVDELDNQFIIKMISATNIAADKYYCVIIGA